VLLCALILQGFWEGILDDWLTERRCTCLLRKAGQDNEAGRIGGSGVIGIGSEVPKRGFAAARLNKQAGSSRCPAELVGLSSSSAAAPTKNGAAVREVGADKQGTWRGDGELPP